ncbi:LysR family transcriptional regulator [Paraburkholderia unamae]|uniref:LysR family transcriptional regulator n=1 Tax=Paraburkholderia unamae TaxID=219649 RepID=A0ABX5KLU9_9BURK|nr:LysR family transcriptional regulator [Paraburkholderia unamae]PVX80005.1 LysR family transcriptional regulator [Paraburkholderia unamae]RAR52272.1 LysR family transcriptional regulator [Paraburkholderia unamae]CAG9268635.1 LysR family transcriptional regulator [Paraburkholderia unamae]
MTHILHSTALRYFVEVANTGSIAEASVRLHVASSAISRQIAKLEYEVHAQLFDRQSRGMILSSAGEALLGYARRSLLEAEQIVHDIDSAQNSLASVVKLACSEGFATDFLPSLIHVFRQTNPRVHFELSVTRPDDATRLVRIGDADLALTFSLTVQTGVNIIHACRAPVFALMRRDHPLARRRRLTLSEIAEHPLLLSEPGTTIRTLIDVAAGAEGIALTPVFVTNNSQALYRYAQLSGAITFSGALTVRGKQQSDALVAVPLAGKVQQRRVEVQTMMGRALPAAVREFADFLVAELKHVPGMVRETRASRQARE